MVNIEADIKKIEKRIMHPNKEYISTMLDKIKKIYFEHLLPKMIENYQNIEKWSLEKIIFISVYSNFISFLFGVYFMLNRNDFTEFLSCGVKYVK